MVIAELTNSNNDKIVGAIVTAIFLLGVYSALQITDLPSVKQKTEVYEEINWTRFQPKPKTVMPKAEPVKSPKMEQPVKIEMPPEAPPKLVAQKIDLSALKAQFQPVAKTKPTLGAIKSKSKKTSSSAKNAKVDLKQSSVLGGLNTLLGESSSRLKMTGRGSNGRKLNNGSRLTAGRGSSIDSGNGSSLGGGPATLSAPGGKSAQTAAPEIGMLDFSQMGAGFEDLSPIYRELIEWMKRNPGSFPGVVSRFSEKAPGDLTSVISFQVNGRSFDMFLLCKENLFEVRICLIEGNSSTYLIDRGFKEKSSYLRVGSVNHTPTGKILSFGTTRKAAANDRTKEFYQLFLSWWESAK